MAQNQQEYGADQIQILEGLEAVRKRPGMYIGSTSERGLHHLVWEIVDNAIDEALNGFGNEILIEINKDGSCTVTDYGRGMPVGMHKSGKNTLQVIFTVLHAGGKFSDQGGYKTAGGLHGVGASVVNALSEWLEVEVCRDKKRYLMRFENGGKTTEPLHEIGPLGRDAPVAFARLAGAAEVAAQREERCRRYVARVRPEAHGLYNVGGGAY